MSDPAPQPSAASARPLLSRLAQSLLPRYLVGRMLALVLGALLVAGLLLIYFWMIFGDQNRISTRFGALARTIALMQIAADAEPEHRQRLIAVASWRRPGSGCRNQQSGRDRHHCTRRALPFLRQRTQLPPSWVQHPRLEEIAQRVSQISGFEPNRLRALAMPGARNHRSVILALSTPDGKWITSRLPLFRPGRRFPAPGLIWMTLFGLVLAGLIVWVARRLAAPLTRLARAADQFGLGNEPEILVEEGPAEIRRMISAFNRMTSRLRRHQAERNRVFAALSHDLRTPIAALRLRAELVDDASHREKLLATIQEMTRLTESTLDFLRNEQAERPRATDLAALLRSIADDRFDMRQNVQIIGDLPRTVVALRPVALCRAIANVLDNAIEYGAGAEISLHQGDGLHVIKIADRGPGIANGDRERVFEPFIRLDESRQAASGHSGLGLAIARDVARAHGGDVVLRDRPGGGLVVELRLQADMI